MCIVWFVKREVVRISLEIGVRSMAKTKDWVDVCFSHQQSLLVGSNSPLCAQTCLCVCNVCVMCGVGLFPFQFLQFTESLEDHATSLLSVLQPCCLS